ncbi:MAG: relaxase domain-containing protein [Acidimicrobiia bacterium]|nr:relaxase domain-containing protein [Acidimicrobiia bacterium]
MRFTITPLGGASADVDRIVAGIVEYLHPKGATPPEPRSASHSGPSAYYADSGEEPGRWLGRSARAAGLVGQVHRQDFAKVLAGRDPHTGERLITAQGSAGRRATLGSGNHTLVGKEGEPLYGEADAASVLGVNQRDSTGMLDVGTALGLARLATPTSTPTPAPGSPDAPRGLPLRLPLLRRVRRRLPTSAPTSTPTSPPGSGGDSHFRSHFGACPWSGSHFAADTARRVVPRTDRRRRRHAARDPDRALPVPPRPGGGDRPRRHRFGREPRRPALRSPRPPGWQG